jgi:hypothetical protein
LDEAHSGSKEDSNVATRLANAVCNGLKQHGGNERFASSCFQVHNCVLLFCLLQHFQLITTKTQINSTHPSPPPILLELSKEKEARPAPQKNQQERKIQASSMHAYMQQKKIQQQTDPFQQTTG